MKILDYGSHNKKQPNRVNVDLMPHANVDIVVGTDVLPFDDCSFDIVISNQVMEHNLHIESYYREAARVLKDNGYMFLHFPHRWQPNPGHYMKWFSHWFKPVQPGYNWQPRSYHKRIALKYFDKWVDLAPYYRQVKAVLFKQDMFKLLEAP